jgi:glycosyltransferase involved in cell wall biosynthesis
LCERAHLASRVTFAGELSGDELDACYDGADAFVLPTHYEGYGMAVAEALARGIPVVSTPTGAIEHLVGRDAGILVPAGNVPALASALRTLLTDDARRATLRAGAIARRAQLPTWDASAAAMDTILTSVLEQ